MGITDEALPVALVGGSRLLRQQHLDALAQELVDLVSEHLLDFRVDGTDDAFSIDHRDPVG